MVSLCVPKIKMDYYLVKTIFNLYFLKQFINVVDEPVHQCQFCITF